jgi:hypothetical protein
VEEMSIGALARRSRLSPKALRLYDGLGLLSPARVDVSGLWGFGKEFIALIRDKGLPRIEGREGAFFCVYWGQVSADSDGPIEWCKPVPNDQAEELAAQFPELTLRIEPAHREAYIDLGPGGQIDATPVAARLRGPRQLA